MRKNVSIWMAIALMAFVCINFVACGKDSDDNAEIPADLAGTWYKVSGSSKHNMEFTFNSDGTGTGHINHNNIISMNQFIFKYNYKSNGRVECKGTRIMVDENAEEEVSTKLTFQYSGQTMTLKEADNSNWLGAVFNKSGSYIDDDNDDDNDSNEPLNVSIDQLYGKWNLAGFGKSPSVMTGNNPGEYFEINSNYSIIWGGQQNGRTDYYSYTYSDNTLNLRITSGKGSNTTFKIVSFSSKEMVLYQPSSGYYRKWTK